jgi:hypothetical protein
MHRETNGNWPTLAVPREDLAAPLPVEGDACLSRLSSLERMFAEADGSFVWTSPREGPAWQVDGNFHEREGRVLLVDLKGICPEQEFDRLLAAFGWPEHPVMMHLVREGVFLAENSFREHAEARFRAGLKRG